MSMALPHKRELTEMYYTLLCCTVLYGFNDKKQAQTFKQALKLYEHSCTMFHSPALLLCVQLAPDARPWPSCCPLPPQGSC